MRSERAAPDADNPDGNEWHAAVHVWSTEQPDLQSYIAVDTKPGLLYFPYFWFLSNALIDGRLFYFIIIIK